MGFGDIVPWRRKRENLESAPYPMSHFQRRMNELFDDFFSDFDMEPFRGFSDRFGAFNPKVNVAESEKEIRVTAELPGMTDKDVEITLTSDALILRGEKREEHGERSEEGKPQYVERSYGRFQRVIPLSCEIEEDRVDASCKNGVLQIVLPKTKSSQSSTKKISIRGS